LLLRPLPKPVLKDEVRPLLKPFPEEKEFVGLFEKRRRQLIYEEFLELLETQIILDSNYIHSPLISETVITEARTERV